MYIVLYTVYFIVLYTVYFIVLCTVQHCTQYSAKYSTLYNTVLYVLEYLGYCTDNLNGLVRAVNNDSTGAYHNTLYIIQGR